MTTHAPRTRFAPTESEIAPILKHFSILGHKVEDRVTGFKGVAATLAFDLYGCTQVVVNPGVDKEGKPREQGWFDINRLTVTSKEPVLPPPSFTRTAETHHRRQKVRGREALQKGRPMLNREEVETKVKGIIVAKTGVAPDKVVPEARLTEDLGADSLDLMGIVMEIEDDLNIEVSDDEVENTKTVGEFYALAAKKVGAE